jgi:RNA-directed DNA polymerase
LGGVSVHWLCLEFAHLLHKRLELSPQFKRKGVTDEQISEAIACVMVLSISHYMGSEVSVPTTHHNVNQDWLLKFLAHRFGDKRIQRMVKRILKAGVAEDGSVTISNEGTPQGVVISPLLANIYLHYALDLWFERIYRKGCTGYTRLIRYADDFVVCFQYKADAERFRVELGQRLSKFSLEVEPTKTKVMEFGRFAVQNAKKRGGRAWTFDFLGLAHYCGTRRNGTGFRMKRMTARKKFVAKLRIFKEWLMEARTLKTRELWKTACSKLRGHYNYYGVTDNYRALVRFGQAVNRLLLKWLNRT